MRFRAISAQVDGKLRYVGPETEPFEREWQASLADAEVFSNETEMHLAMAWADNHGGVRVEARPLYGEQRPSDGFYFA